VKTRSCTLVDLESRNVERSGDGVRERPYMKTFARAQPVCAFDISRFYFGVPYGERMLFLTLASVLGRTSRRWPLATNSICTRAARGLAFVRDKSPGWAR
jgi:hypothetical protein